MNELQTLMDSIKGLAELDDEVLKDDAMQAILDNVDEQFSPGIIMIIEIFP